MSDIMYFVVEGGTSQHIVALVRQVMPLYMIPSIRRRQVLNQLPSEAGIHGSTTDQYLKKHLGDVIIAVDGLNITKRDDLINYIGQYKIAGNNITLTVYRNGHAINLKATLSARPSLIPFLTTRSAIPSFPNPRPPMRPPIIPTPHP